MRDFYEICSICSVFSVALIALKIWMDLLNGVTELWEFKVEGVAFPPNFHRLLAAKIYLGPKYVLEVQERARDPLSPCQVSPAAGVAKNVQFLSVCLFVCLSVTLLNVRVCAPDFAMKALEYRNDFDAVG